MNSTCSVTEREKRYLELETNLKGSFREFFMFSLGLIKAIDTTNNNLKFAVVNMQIALELFLKYYFLKKEKYEWLFVSKKKTTFKDFSIILNSFFSKDSDLLVTHKEHLKKILNARNKIVHEGKNEWDDDIMINLVNTTLFIQNVLNRNLMRHYWKLRFHRCAKAIWKITPFGKKALKISPRTWQN